MKTHKETIAEAIQIADDDPWYERVVTPHPNLFGKFQKVEEQISTLKAILQEKQSEDVLELLCVIYLAARAPTAAPLRRASCGALRKLSPEIVEPIMWERLSYLMEKDPIICSEEISVLASWQTHGSHVVQNHFDEILQHLEHAWVDLNKLLFPLGYEHSFLNQERLLNKSAKLVVCIATVMKLLDGPLPAKMERITEMTKAITKVLQEDSSPMSCRLAFGNALPQIMVLSGITPLDAYQTVSEPLRSNPLSKVCIIAGMITVVELNIVEGKENFHGFYEELLTELERIASIEEIQQTTLFTICCLRTIFQWTEKMVAHLEVCQDMLENRYESLLKIGFVHVEHFIDAVQHQGRALLKIVFSALAAVAAEKYEDYLKATFARLLNESHHKRSKYAPLTMLAKHIKVAPFIQRDVVLAVYRTLKEKSMLCYVEDFVREIGKVHLEEVSPSIWESTWLDTFFDVYTIDKVPLIEHLVPTLLKLYPSLGTAVLSRRYSEECTLLALRVLPLESLLEDQTIIDKSQWSTDETIRVSLLRVLTNCHKSCEPLNPKLIPRLEVMVKLNSPSQLQSLHQEMFSAFKKLFQRIHESSVYWSKPDRVHPVYGDQLQDVLKRQSDFVTWMFKFCIQQLHPGSSFFTRSTILVLLESLAPLVTDKWDDITIATLIQCIKDTYETNKRAVMRIIDTIPSTSMPYYIARDKWINSAISLTRSARPPDCVTGAYMLRILAKDRDVSSKLDMIRTLTTELMTQISKATTQGLVIAASTGPMYGALVCLRALINDLLSEPIPVELRSRCQDLFKEIFGHCKTLAAIVGPHVTNASPEGHVDADDKSDLAEKFAQALYVGFGKNLEATDFVKASAVASQMLMLCCWRSHKEVSLTFGDFAKRIKPLMEQEILSKAEFVEMGSYFMDELSAVRHRGAFEQAYVGFLDLCRVLWQCSEPDLQKLPLKWLTELVAIIYTDAVSSTRRSAGLPYIVQAILACEPPAHSCKALKQAMGELLPLTRGSHSETARVHALNVIRALYRDTRLGETIIPFVGWGMIAALKGFDHSVWAVRNACTLLFTTLITRIFGVNRSKQNLERKNCYTGQTFFARFPELFAFLSERISTLLEKRERHTGLYPCLLILTRLFPSLHETVLSEFLPMLDRCSRSPLVGIREAGARAFASLLPIEKQANTLRVKLELLSSSDASKQCPNDIHGILLQIQSVLDFPTCTAEAKRVVIEKIQDAKRVLEARCSVVASLYLELVTRLEIYEDVYMNFQSSDFSLEGRNNFTQVLTRYKSEFIGRYPQGYVVSEVEMRTDHEKLGYLEACLKNNWVPFLLSAVLFNPSAEHPDVQKFAFDLASKGLIDTREHSIEDHIANSLKQLPQASIPMVAESIFSCLAKLAQIATVQSACSTIPVLRQYSAANQDPSMRLTAAQLAENLLRSHRGGIFEQANLSGTYVLFCEALVNLVVDNDLSVRNRIISGLSVISEEKLKNNSPLDALLGVCSEMSTNKKEFASFLLQYALHPEEVPTDVELDEQPFEKSELNTFHDAIAIAGSIYNAVVKMGVSGLEFDASPFLDSRTRAAAATDCDLAYNRQLEADLVATGLYSYGVAMCEGDMHIQSDPLIKNEFFCRFAASVCDPLCRIPN